MPYYGFPSIKTVDSTGPGIHTDIIAQAYSEQAYKERLLKSKNYNELQDDEILERILSYSNPTSDMKPLTYLLLNIFGDLNRIIAASPCDLREVLGVSQATVNHIKLLEITAHRMARSAIADRIVFDHWETLIIYLRTVLAYQEIEKFRVLFLDRNNVLIADEELGVGTIDHVPVYPREIVKHALRHSASSLIIAHNHPSGDPSPSNLDIEMTYKIEDATRLFGIGLQDHIIIGKGIEFSLRSEGYIR